MEKLTLVVAVRGWTTSGEFLLFGRPGGELRPEFVKALSDDLPDAEIWAPALDLGMFSMRSAEALCENLYMQICEKIDARPHIERIIFLGYSSGSVLARRVFCMAHGAAEDGTLSHPPALWADKIERMVMLAGITRGWEFSSASPAHVRFLGPILPKVASTLGWWKAKRGSVESTTPLIWQLKRGAPFVVSARIQYVNVLEALRSRLRSHKSSPLRANGLPSTVFLIGAKDEFLSPADCTELGPRVEFVFIELKRSNHSEAIQIAGNSPAATERRRCLVAAIKEDFEALSRESWAVPAADIDDYLDPMDITETKAGEAMHHPVVEHAVIVVHGIRDNGFWTKRVAREIKTLGRESGLIVRAPTPSYGYFSMLDFVMPGGREQAAFWFMERYADVKNHFPSAKISFVGHSNGSYIAARALELCAAIRFENVVLAGSVVRRDFPWARFPRRVRRVLNYVGSTDCVVAFLPAVFELLRLPWLDVGGAGAFGFREAEPPPAVAKRLPGSGAEDVELTEVRFVWGGHAAAIAEDYWPEIAQFALFGTPPSRPPITRDGSTERLFRVAPICTVVLALIATTLLLSPFIVVATALVIIARQGPPSGFTVALALLVFSASLVVSWLARRFMRLW